MASRSSTDSPGASGAAARGARVRRRFGVVDLAIILTGLAACAFLISAASRWAAPLTPVVSIDLSFTALPLYAGYSLLRMLLGYILSLVFTLVYGHIAATHRRASVIMIPVLDILQSIPILSFLPAVILALVAAFPHSNLGLELASVILIFTSQAWNMTFSYYHSARTVPADLREVAMITHLRPWQRFFKLELPSGMIGLIWNSITRSGAAADSRSEARQRALPRSLTAFFPDEDHWLMNHAQAIKKALSSKQERSQSSNRLLVLYELSRRVARCASGAGTREVMMKQYHGKYVIRLSQEQRRFLEAMLHHAAAPVKQYLVARVLLMSGQKRGEREVTDGQIAQALSISRRTVIRIKQRFVQENLGVALIGNYPRECPERRCLDGKGEAQLIHLACSKAPDGRQRWTIELLAEQMVKLEYVEHISPETVRKTLKKTS